MLEEQPDTFELYADPPEAWTTKVRCGFKGKNQLPLFMIWVEDRRWGHVEYARVVFNSRDWIGF